jgi:glycosyltransferase involved in cell wall biosynthesis
MLPQKISIVVPVYNSIKNLKTCLDSMLIAMEEHGNAELILLDNGSTDGSYELLITNFAQRARIFRREDDTVASLRNEGARIATGDYLCFTDSDMLVPKDYLQSAAALFQRVGCDALVATLALPHSPTWIEKTWGPLHGGVPEGYVPLYGGTFIIKRAAFERVRGFNPKLITGEDMELGDRLRSAGYKIYRSPSFACVHKGEPRTLFEFLRRQAWHGFGMFSNQKTCGVSRMLIMTVCHIGLTAAGVATLAFVRVSVGLRVAIFILLSAVVPSITVAWRFAGIRKFYRPWRSLLLYYMYYSGRAISLFPFAAAHFSSKRPAQYSPRSNP